MRIAALSDMHGELPVVPKADLVLLSGDIAPDLVITDVGHPRHSSNALGQLDWMGTTFRKWLKSLGEAYATPGNHDWWAESQYAEQLAALDLPWTLLIDEGAQILGPEPLTVWGTPWTRPLSGWAYEAPEDRIEMAADLIPSGVDILMLHSPIYGYGDLADYDHVGSTALLEAVKRVRPRLVTSGHIHDAKGEWDLGPTHVVNVSVVNRPRQLTYPVWTGELAPRRMKKAA